MVAARLGDGVRVTEVVLVLKALRGHEEAETQRCERSWKAFGEGSVSVTIDDPRLKGSCK